MKTSKTINRNKRLKTNADASLTAARFALALELKLLAIPRRLAQRIALDNDPASIEALIEKEFRETIESAAEEFRNGRCPRVPLAQIAKAIYETNQTRQTGFHDQSHRRTDRMRPPNIGKANWPK